MRWPRVRFTARSQRLFAWVIAIASVPCIFFGTIFGAMMTWGRISRDLATRDAERFVQETRGLVAQWRANPNVHSVEIVPTPDGPFDLVVRFDVDDKETYLALEDDFSVRTSDRQFQAQFAGKLQSGERLPMNFGAAAQGIAEVGKAMNFFACLALMSVSLPIVFLYVALRRIRRAETTR